MMSRILKHLTGTAILWILVIGCYNARPPGAEDRLQASSSALIGAWRMYEACYFADYPDTCRTAQEVGTTEIIAFSTGGRYTRTVNDSITADDDYGLYEGRDPKSGTRTHLLGINSTSEGFYELSARFEFRGPDTLFVDYLGPKYSILGSLHYMRIRE